MSTEEFTITVKRSQVEGRLDPRRGTWVAERVPPDPLSLATVNLLEKWLARWEWIAAAKGESSRPLLVPDTFDVLGDHLWKLVLDNGVGDALIRACAQAADSEPLRVLMSFDDDVEEQVAGLPWEFLRAAGRDGFFLATKTNLVLSRYLRMGDPPEIREPDQQLRVIFVVTLPGMPEFDDERAGIREMCDKVAALGPVVDIETVDPWQASVMIDKLQQKADIVHVIGVCRGSVRSPELYLASQGGGGWHGAQQLVNALVQRQATRPELVVLHLCDWPHSEANENFERLAPWVVRAGVPAVLAMQYPMAPGEAGSFVEGFYDKLANGIPIGQAVQLARNAMYFQGSDRTRGFGTPVLYTSTSERPLVVARGGLGGGSSSLLTDQPTVAAAGVGTRIRTLLIQTVEQNSPTPEVEEELTAWVQATAWPNDPRQAWMILQNYARDQADLELRPALSAMKGVIQKEIKAGRLAGGAP